MIRRAFLLLTALAAFGCSDDGTGPSSIEGRYTLRTVNGATVPVTVTQGGVLYSVQSGFLQINADNSFTFGLTLSAQQGGQTVTQNAGGVGVWARNNNALQLNYSDGSSPDVATITGDEISMTTEGIALTFRR